MGIWDDFFSKAKSFFINKEHKVFMIFYSIKLNIFLETMLL